MFKAELTVEDALAGACREAAAGMSEAKLDAVIERSIAPKDKKQGK